MRLLEPFLQTALWPLLLLQKGKLLSTGAFLLSSATTELPPSMAHPHQRSQKGSRQAIQRRPQTYSACGTPSSTLMAFGLSLKLYNGRG